MLRHAPVMSSLPDTAPSWFRSFEGRRYIRHLGGLVVLKIVLLAILYFIFIAPQLHADTSPQRVFDAVHGGSGGTSASGKPTDPQTPRESVP